MKYFLLVIMLLSSFAFADQQYVKAETFVCDSLDSIMKLTDIVRRNDRDGFKSLMQTNKCTFTRTRYRADVIELFETLNYYAYNKVRIYSGQTSIEAWVSVVSIE